MIGKWLFSGICELKIDCGVWVPPGVLVLGLMYPYITRPFNRWVYITSEKMYIK